MWRNGAAATTSASAFNPAIYAVLQGVYANLSQDPNKYAINGFVPSGDIAPAKRGFSIAESELGFSANVDDTKRGEGNARLAFVGQDLYQAGYLLMQGLYKKIPEDQPVHALLGLSRPGESWAEDRIGGAKKFLDEAKAVGFPPSADATAKLEQAVLRVHQAFAAADAAAGNTLQGVALKPVKRPIISSTGVPLKAAAPPPRAAKKK